MVRYHSCGSYSIIFKYYYFMLDFQVAFMYNIDSCQSKVSRLNFLWNMIVLRLIIQTNFGYLLSRAHCNHIIFASLQFYFIFPLSLWFLHHKFCASWTSVVACFELNHLKSRPTSFLYLTDLHILQFPALPVFLCWWPVKHLTKNSVIHRMKKMANVPKYNSNRLG